MTVRLALLRIFSGAALSAICAVSAAGQERAVVTPEPLPPVTVTSPEAKPPKPVVVTDRFPQETMHGWKFIAFGPDGKLYVPVGAPCNICEPDPDRYALISRINPDGSGYEVITQAKRKRPIHAVALTGFGTEDDIRRSREAGFDLHLVKPIDLHELETVLEKVET